MAFSFSEETESRFQALLRRYPEENPQAALIPTLLLIQEQAGHLTLEAMGYVAERIGVSPAVVLNTATFYTLLRKEPLGRHHIQVCGNVSCFLRSSDGLIDVIRQKLGIGPGEVTRDRLFSCEQVECLAACGTAPAAQINWTYHENLSPESFGEIIDRLRRQAGGSAEAEREAPHAPS